jgi:hypothetical protein
MWPPRVFYRFVVACQGIAGTEFKTVGDGSSDGTQYSMTGNNYLDLNVDACYKLGEKMDLRGGIIYTMTGKNSTQNMGVLLRFGYMVK